jgi:hypothetical protein
MVVEKREWTDWILGIGAYRRQFGALLGVRCDLRG